MELNPDRGRMWLGRAAAQQHSLARDKQRRFFPEEETKFV
jgi:hypothetical protein